MNESRAVVGVTGANGFIGRNIAYKLRKEGFKVVFLQRTSSVSGGDEIRFFDLSKLETINEELLYGIDILIHAAALVHQPQANAQSYKAINFTATKTLRDIY